MAGVATAGVTAGTTTVSTLAPPDITTAAAGPPTTVAAGVATISLVSSTAALVTTHVLMVQATRAGHLAIPVPTGIPPMLHVRPPLLSEAILDVLPVRYRLRELPPLPVSRSYVLTRPPIRSRLPVAQVCRPPSPVVQIPVAPPLVLPCKTPDVLSTALTT